VLGCAIEILLSGVVGNQEASSKSACCQQALQVQQRGHGQPRITQLHACAGGTVQHPSRQDDNYTGGNLDVDDITAGSSLAVLLPKPAPIQWVPTIEDFDFLPDMGRMTPRCRAAKIMRTALLCALALSGPVSAQLAAASSEATRFWTSHKTLGIRRWQSHFGKRHWPRQPYRSDADDAAARIALPRRFAKGALPRAK